MIPSSPLPFSGAQASTVQLPAPVEDVAGSVQKAGLVPGAPGMGIIAWLNGAKWLEMAD